MTNTELLQQKIDAAGLSPTAMAAALDRSVPTFYSRMRGESEFTATEIRICTKVLNLSNAERDAIFFW